MPSDPVRLVLVDGDPQLGLPRAPDGVGEHADVVVGGRHEPVADVDLGRQPTDLGELLGTREPDLHAAP